MSYKDFSGKFELIAENVISRYQMGGVLPGDFCVIRNDALKNSEIKNKPSQFIDKVTEFMKSGLNLKVSAVKTSKPDTQNQMATDPTDKYYVDVVVEYAPGLWKDILTLPLECIDIVKPEGNNWSPDVPEQLKKKDPSHNAKKLELTDKELNDRTQANQRIMPTTNVKLEVGVSEPKDGRKQAKKAKEVKESVSLEDVYELIK